MQHESLDRDIKAIEGQAIYAFIISADAEADTVCCEPLHL